ncbi:MAG: hypothetical protein M1840_003574 [Geoglossum simile]|nr:MAG: hypothetical protein M1840_003574 [Geoglossum simile]
MVKTEGNSWNTLDIGIVFDRPSNITAQLEKVANGGGPAVAARREMARRKYVKERLALEPSKSTAALEEEFGKTNLEERLTPDEQFKNLKAFYISQLMDSSTSSAPLDLSSTLGYGSPGALSRIMGLYSGVTGYGGKKAKAKSKPMREASSPQEGLKLLGREEDVIEKMKKTQWGAITSLSQRAQQRVPVRFLSEVRPVPILLRTKRSKRCKTCRHILVKPESKVQTTRFRIRLVAINYIPTMTLRLLHPMPTDYNSLPSLRPIQFLLTLRNPLFDPIHITLATPSHTPGRFPSRVTILCPEFEIGANTDVWDEALSTGGKEKRRTKAESSEGQAEAGKIWEKGRNWTTVVVEVVPANLNTTPSGERAEKQPSSANAPLEEDDDVLEIPIFVRAEYETDPAADGGDAGGSTATGAEKEKEKRELAYWCVFGVGRIAYSEPL